MPKLDDRVNYIVSKHLDSAFKEIDEALELYNGKDVTDVFTVLEQFPGLGSLYDLWIEQENEQ